MIVLVTGAVAGGKSTLLRGLRRALTERGWDLEEASDRVEVHASVIREAAEGHTAPHGRVLRHEPGDLPGVDTRVTLHDAHHLLAARDALLACLMSRVRGPGDDHGVLLVEWATGPRVDFYAAPGWSGDASVRWLDQTLDDLLLLLRGRGLLPFLWIVWVDRGAPDRAASNETRRDAVPTPDFSLLGPGGGGLHELSPEGFRLVASLAEGHRFQAVRNTGSPEELELLGYSIGRTWARPAAAMPDAWSGDSPGPPAADSEPLPEPARSWIDGARRFAYGEHAGDAGGHDPFHVERVWHMARRLAGTSPLADRVVVELAALLHDVDDWKRAPPADGVAGGRTGRWLSGAGVPEALSRQVLETIAQVSFLGVGQPRPVTPEAHVVQDADRLDALGAVGIARLFAFGGSRGRPLHDPGIPPAPGEDAAAARGRRSTSLNHIYEKILHLRDLLNTDPARCLGAGRHRFVEEFLARFLDEWEGRR